MAVGNVDNAEPPEPQGRVPGAKNAGIIGPRCAIARDAAQDRIVIRKGLDASEPGNPAHVLRVPEDRRPAGPVPPGTASLA
jgi:hypothetical protein